MASKTVWVIGASSGIGQALTHQFLGNEDRLIVSSHDERKLNSAVKEVVYVEKDLLVKPLDLEQPDAFPDIVEEVFEWANGKIDVVVFSSGLGQRASFEELEYWVFEKIMQVNFMSYSYLTKLIVPRFMASKGGKFVVISSVQGKFGIPNRTAYAASKHALHGFFDSLRAECYPLIKVLLVCPAYVRTRFSINAVKGDGTENRKMDKGQKLGMAPEDCAQAIIKAIEKDKQEIVLGRSKEKLGVWIKRFFPSLLERMVRSSKFVKNK
ncbi:SDR family NAD(P)-dependent oxidoreductase [Persicobacter psychrovividus]|uniref:Short-chain dehydrogenase n=1 Tax=Persicobacter psychrovividus TaxID=387638 RepID=A0ABN6LD94_9BACT|nr:short-chain dehydrogenase [Persicobacter psychrovividus]